MLGRMIESKTCPRCGSHKPAADFYVCKRTPSRPDRLPAGSRTRRSTGQRRDQPPDEHRAVMPTVQRAEEPTDARGVLRDTRLERGRRQEACSRRRCVCGGGAVMVGCRSCHGRHAIGHHAPGSRVVVGTAAAQRDGWPPGSKGIVTQYTICAGSRHQEVHVRRRSSTAVFAPCELAAEAPATEAAKPSEWRSYTTMSRGEFLATLKGYGRATVRVLSDPDAQQPAARRRGRPRV